MTPLAMQDVGTVPHYDSADTAHPAVRELADLLRYRDLLRVMVVNIAKSRYKRSVLGVSWTLMNPLLHMTVLTIAGASIFSMVGFACAVLSAGRSV